MRIEKSTQWKSVEVEYYYVDARLVEMFGRESGVLDFFYCVASIHEIFQFYACKVVKKIDFIFLP